MERVSQVIKVDAPVVYLRYALALDTMVSAWVYDVTTQADLYPLERVPMLNMTLVGNQFAVDDERSAIFLPAELVGSYIRVQYYTEGQINPFYVTSDLYTFVSKVIKWTSNRIVDGFFFYREQCDEESSLYRLAPGSFVYEGRFYAFAGQLFRIGDYAPPTLVGQVRAYVFYIDQDVLDSHLDRQLKLLMEVGILRSAVYESFDEAKLDVMSQLEDVSDVHKIVVAYAYVTMNESRSYDMWIEYVDDDRTL